MVVLHFASFEYVNNHLSTGHHLLKYILVAEFTTFLSLSATSGFCQWYMLVIAFQQNCSYSTLAIMHVSILSNWNLFPWNVFMCISCALKCTEESYDCQLVNGMFKHGSHSPMDPTRYLWHPNRNSYRNDMG